MKKLLLIALAAGASVTSVVPAEARQGCGIGLHRGPHGACRVNRGRGAVVVAGPRIGVFYPGRGYWHGGRYWGHRYAHRGGWRYR